MCSTVPTHFMLGGYLLYCTNTFNVRWRPACTLPTSFMLGGYLLHCTSMLHVSWLTACTVPTCLMLSGYCCTVWICFISGGWPLYCTIILYVRHTAPVHFLQWKEVMQSCIKLPCAVNVCLLCLGAVNGCNVSFVFLVLIGCFRLQCSRMDQCIL
jgi:hypothetical protein